MTMVVISSTSGGAAQLFGSIAVQMIEFPPIGSNWGDAHLLIGFALLSRLLCQGSLGELSRVRRVRTQWMSHFPLVSLVCAKTSDQTPQTLVCEVFY